MKIFSGNSTIELGNKICKYLDIPVGKIHLHQFPSGEQYCQFQENVRGKDVYLIQSLSNPVNDNLMQLLIMADAARRASADRITAVVPYFGYARQDRKDKSRVPISAKLVMNLLGSAGFDRIVTMDLHSPQVGGFTDLPFDHLTIKPALAESIKDINIDVIVAPDIGAVKRVEEFSSIMKKDMAIISKKRNNERDVEVKHFIGDVNGKNVLIIDDLTESAGTLIEAASVCKEQKANEVYCAISHGCFTSIGDMRLSKAFNENIINRLFVSNSIDNVENLRLEKGDGLYGSGRCVSISNFRDKLTIVNVAPLFATAIKHIHNNESVSELFSV